MSILESPHKIIIIVWTVLALTFVYYTHDILYFLMHVGYDWLYFPPNSFDWIRTISRALEGYQFPYAFILWLVGCQLLENRWVKVAAKTGN